MIFIKRNPGESVVLETPGGEIVVQMLDNGEVGLELPRGVRVAQSPQNASKTWLPARPNSKRSRVA